MSKPSKSLKSHLLIASPKLEDSNFAKTVVLLIEHGEDGALGVVLNRPLDRTIDEIWKQVHDVGTSCSSPVFWGGPVAGPLMVIHRIQALADLEIMPGVYFSTTKSNIEAVLETESPDARFFVYCSGWSAGQLEDEIDEGAWSVVEATNQDVFDADPDLWKRISGESKGTPIFGDLGVKQMPRDPSLN